MPIMAACQARISMDRLLQRLAPRFQTEIVLSVFHWAEVASEISLLSGLLLARFVGSQLLEKPPLNWWAVEDSNL